MFVCYDHKGISSSLYKCQKIQFILFILASKIIHLSDGTVAETTSSILTKNATTTTAAKIKWADIEAEQH